MIHVHRYKKPAAGEVYKFCPCGKRKKVVQLREQRRALKRKAEALWREFAHTRDGSGCQIKKHYPELNLHHTDQMQVDHFFPRADKNLYFDPSNSTVLCSACNYLKSNGSPQSVQILMAVKEIVFRRDGEKKFYEMCDVNNRRQPNRDWDREYYLEEIIKNLQIRISDLGEKI